MAGSLGEVAYDIIANNKTGAGLDGARSGFVTTAGDIINALESVSAKLAEFDEKNAKLNTNLGITALTLGMNAEELRGWAGELSSSTDSIDEMAAVIDALARSGIKSHDAMISTAEGFDALADATQQEADIMTTSMIPAFNAFKIPLQDVGKYSDALAFTFNTTQVSADEFGRTMAKMGPELNNAGLSMNDVLAIMVNMKEAGYTNKNMMTELTAAMAKSNDVNKDGKVSRDEILAYLKLSPAGLAEETTALATNSKGYTEKAATVVNSNKSITESHKNMVDNFILGNGAWTTSITSAAATITSVLGGLVVPFMVLNTLVPSLTAGITTALSGLAASLSSALTTAGTAIAGSLVAAIAAGVVLGLAGVWVLLKTGVLDALAGLGDAISESDIGEVIMDALKIVLAPIGSIGAAIIDIVKGDFASIPDDMAEPFKQADDAIRRYLDGMRYTVDGGISAIASGFGGLGASLSGASGTLSAFAVSAFGGIAGAFQGMSGQIQGVFSQMMAAIQTAITSTAGGFFNAGQNIITSMANGIIAAFNAVKQPITEFFNWIANLIPHSPAKEGPLSQPPNWGSYLTQGMSGAEGQVKSGATSMVQAAADGISGTMAKPATPGSVSTGAGGDTITIAAGAIVINGAGQNAKEIADMVIKQFSDVRRQRGIQS